MCHCVDLEAKRPNRTQAYKVVEVRNGALSSVHASTYLNGVGVPKWEKGKPIRAKRIGRGVIRGRKKFFGINHRGESTGGIYVYLNRRHALRMVAGHYDRVVIAVAIDPKDWLTSSRNASLCKIATYRKATMVGRVYK